MLNQQRICTLFAALAVVALFSGGDWAQFRGNDSTGVASEKSLPVVWTDNVAWKAELPGRGPASPIVVAGRVFVTASSGVKQDRLHTICFDAKTGDELWHRQMWATGRTFCHPSSAVAAPSPASDGKRVFSFYSSNDLACYDLDGNLQWFRGLAYDYPKAGNDVGMASSVLVVGDTVVVQVENQGDSFAAGLNAATGETRWRIARPAQANWASPVVMRGKTPQDDVVVLQSPTGLTVHEPRTGKELWAYNQQCSGIPSATADGDILYVPSADTALRPASNGTPEIVWQNNQVGPGSPSPLVYQDRIYAVNRSGVLVCADAAKGDVLWRLRLTGSFWATPIAVGDYLYMVNADGVAQVVRLGEMGEIVGTSELGEAVQATPAVADGALYVRSDKHLWKISGE